jgi:hypothetical protein
MKQERIIVNGKPVIENIIIHHSAGNRCNGFSAEHVFDDFNSVGFNRGFKNNGYDFNTGYSPKWGQNEHTHNGKISYCEYHAAIFEFAKDDYGFVSFIDNPEFKDAKSVGRQRNDETEPEMKARAAKWNKTAFAFVFSGNFEVENIPESMIEYYIKLFRPGAPFASIIDQYPNIKTIGHRDTGDQTDCPGEHLYTYLGRINREIESMRRKA